MTVYLSGKLKFVYNEISMLALTTFNATTMTTCPLVPGQYNAVMVCDSGHSLYNVMLLWGWLSCGFPGLPIRSSCVDSVRDNGRRWKHCVQHNDDMKHTYYQFYFTWPLDKMTHLAHNFTQEQVCCNFLCMSNYNYLFLTNQFQLDCEAERKWPYFIAIILATFLVCLIFGFLQWLICSKGL